MRWWAFIQSMLFLIFYHQFLFSQRISIMQEQSIISSTKPYVSPNSNLELKLRLLQTLQKGSYMEAQELIREISKKTATNKPIFEKFDNFMRQNHDGIMEMEAEENDEKVTQAQIVDDPNQNGDFDEDNYSWSMSESESESEEEDKENLQPKTLNQKRSSVTLKKPIIGNQDTIKTQKEQSKSKPHKCCKTSLKPEGSPNAFSKKNPNNSQQNNSSNKPVFKAATNGKQVSTNTGSAIQKAGNKLACKLKV